MTETDVAELASDADRRPADVSGGRLRALLRGQTPDRLTSHHPKVDALLTAAHAAGCEVAPAAVYDAEIAAARGATLLDIATRLDVPMRRVEVDSQWQRRPALTIVIDREHPEVFVPHGARFRRLTPAGGAAGAGRGVDKLPSDLVNDQDAYVVYVGLGAEPTGLRALLRVALAGGVTRDIPWVVAAAALAGVFGLVVPLLTGAVVGRIIPTASEGELRAVGVAAALTVAASLLVAIAQGMLILRLASRSNLLTTSALWHRVTRLRVPELRAHSAGELAQRIFGLDAVRALITSALAAATVAAVSGIANLLAIAILDAALGALVAVIAIVTILVGVIVASRVVDAERRRVGASVGMNGLLVTLFTGIAKLRVAAAEERVRARWVQRFAEAQRAARDSTAVVHVLAVVLAVLPGVIMLTTFLVLDRSIDDGSLGTVATTTVAVGGIAAAVAVLVTVLPQIAAQVPLLEAARPLLAATPEVATGLEDVGALDGRIELRSVSYGYREDQPVLRGVDAVIPAGSFTAIVGPSGAGKSTLAGLLLGFDRPWSGSVLYDGRDLTRLRLDELRRSIGTVTQDATTVPSAIVDVIAGTSGCTEHDAWIAAEQAGLADDIRAMPMGMLTVLSEGGSGLSGGQLQRLMIARALVRRPRVVIFDEATSALDNVAQAHVATSLAGLGATRVIIAHRLSTVRDADQIVVLDEGRVVDSGTFDELLERCELFAAMARRQRF